MTSKKHILICSSKPEMALYTGQYLSGTDTLLVAAQSAADARKYIESESVAAVIIDLLLVDCDGISFARELRAEMPWLPIIVITAAPCELASTNTNNRTRLQFALKQASVNSSEDSLKILHLENNDHTAELIRDTLGSNTGLFRARSVLEAKIALSVRSYDFAMISSDHPLFYSSDDTGSDARNTINGRDSNSLLAIMGHLRPPTEKYNAVYCS